MGARIVLVVKKKANWFDRFGLFRGADQCPSTSATARLPPPSLTRELRSAPSPLAGEGWGEGGPLWLAVQSRRGCFFHSNLPNRSFHRPRPGLGPAAEPISFRKKSVKETGTSAAVQLLYLQPSFLRCSTFAGCVRRHIHVPTNTTRQSMASSLRVIPAKACATQRRQ